MNWDVGVGVKVSDEVVVAVGGEKIGVVGYG